MPSITEQDFPNLFSNGQIEVSTYGDNYLLPLCKANDGFCENGAVEEQKIKGKKVYSWKANLPCYASCLHGCPHGQ
jgi:hypothetical protein